MILILDNYDSFTYNLVRLVARITSTVPDVIRNDQVKPGGLDKYSKIILSPGPGIPSEAGEMIPLIQEYAPSKSILGICLGHQGIAVAFGATLINLQTVYHGISTPILIDPKHQANGIFAGIPPRIEAGRYHSWVVSKQGFPPGWEITARDEEESIMAIKHKTFDVQGLQFHPESIMTPLGETILQNWLNKK